MKLYLSSYGIGYNPAALKSLVGANKQAAVICNAQDLLSKAERDERVARGYDEMNSLGFTPTELDLRDYFDDPQSLAEELRKYGLVWIRGGNSFVLRRAMQQSRFDDVIKPLVKHEEIVYAGFSAGSCVATTDLHGIELVDEPDSVPAHYDKKTIWDGLGFIDKAIAPHYRSNHPESAMVEQSVEYFEKHHIDYIAIHDGEAILVDGQGLRVVG
jgi:dipeptidase E